MLGGEGERRGEASRNRSSVEKPQAASTLQKQGSVEADLSCLEL